MFVKSEFFPFYIWPAIKPNLSHPFTMKKVSFFAVVAIASTFFLASCGSTATETPAEETVVEEAAPAEMVEEAPADTAAAVAQ